MHHVALNLSNKHLLSLLDYSPEEVAYLLEEAERLKKEQKNGVAHATLKGKSLGMIFENASTRTRVSFEVGMTQLGGHSLFLSPRDLQIGRGEPIRDTAHVLSRYVDAIMIRTNSHKTVEELARYATVPVINALTDDFHPCQALADALTIKEHKGKLHGIQLVYVGDGNNVCHSLLEIGAKTGMNVKVSSPPGHEVDPIIFKQAKEAAKETGAVLTLESDPNKAVEQADVIYTDVWTSMGYESEQKSRIPTLMPYQVSDTLVEKAAHDYVFMHCLPAHREEEVTATIIDGDHSIVYDQAENRLHVQKAVLHAVIPHKASYSG